MLDKQDVINGHKALKRTHKCWETDWLPVGAGLMALRREACTLSGGQVGSKSYNAAFGPLLDKHGYSEKDLEKNTRVELLKLMTYADALDQLALVTKDWTPAQRAGLNPRAAWKLVKGLVQGTQRQTKGKGKDTEASTEIEGSQTNNSLEEKLADAYDALKRAIQLDGDIPARVAELWKDQELQPKLVELGAAIAAQAKAKPAKKPAKKRGNGKAQTEDAQPF